MYQGYLIAKYATGYDREVQPWLLPDDAMYQLFDGYVYKGVWNKREGYSQYATGERAGAPYCESRMVHRIVSEAYGTGDGSKGPYTHTLADKPVRRGTVTITAGAQSAVDNGTGGFTTTPAGGSGTINYTTGDVSITFQNNVAGAQAITVTYDAHQGFPVMGVMNYYTQLNTKEMVVADTTYVNLYSAATNQLLDISPPSLLSGDKSNFMSWTNYASPNDMNRLLFVNFKNPIQQYNGSTVTPYPVYTTSTTIASTAYGVGNGTVGPYNFTTPAGTGIVPGSITITAPTGPQVVTDDQFGNLIGAGTGTVDYLNGIVSVTFNAIVPIADPITIGYQSLSDPIDTALHIFQFKDRMVVLYTVESGVQYGRRIRISGTGAFSDIFTSDAIGAGVIDIPSQAFISAADFNRDDLIIFTRTETWSMRYTGNDVTPFLLDRIDESRGSDAPHGTITYLNRTSAESTVGFIVSDGYTNTRSDDKIPDFSYNDINQDNFNLCFAGSVDIDRDHYLIYPTSGSETSDQILITNYEEGNHSIYRLPLSCMGLYINSYDVTWNDLLLYANWDKLATKYGSWREFSFTKGAPIAIGGGHHGQITQLNNTETEDYPVMIRGISIIDGSTLQVTTDYQDYVIGDTIVLEAVTGMVEVNGKQSSIINVIDNYNFQLAIPTAQFSAYVSGGQASKCIEFNCITKKFNPFSENDKKVSCGWLYFYVSTTNTDLTSNKYINGIQLTNPCELSVPGHGYKNNDQVYVNGVLGTTEINNNYYYITVIDSDTISLNDVDATGYTPYVSNGFTSTPDDAILSVRCISNDTEQSTLLNNFNPSPYQVNMSSQAAGNGIKKWYKVYINQTARFVQFQVINNQSGSNVQIHAMMPGMTGVGRMI